MADIRIRKRKRMRSKEIKALSEELEAVLGSPVFGEDDAVDLAESTDFNLIFAGQDIVGIVLDGRPFLTVRGVLRYRPQKRYVSVDMGAVPFITNGADCMGPGVVDADPGIAAGDMVWIRDINNKAPLAVGISERTGAELMEKKAGKAIKTIHNVGDRLWKSGE